MQPIMLPPTEDMEVLRNATQMALNRLAQAISRELSRDAALDGGGKRVTNVARPISPSDAATRSWVEEVIQRLSRTTGTTVITTGSPSTGSGTQLVVEQTLTADATINQPSAPSTGARLTYYLRQDATGGWTFTFNAAQFVLHGWQDWYKGASTTTIVEFVGLADGKWHLAGIPMTGVS